VTPAAPPTTPPGSPNRRSLLAADIALEETPLDQRNAKRRAPDDCHVIIRWPELSKLSTQNML
jgi:hypothetical protein